MTIKSLLENQPEVIKFLKNSHDSKYLSHAYLFDGPDGSGKYEAAIYTSMMLLCNSDDRPCQRCNNCIKVEKGTHLNVMVVEPTNDLIKKEQVEDLIHELSMTSLEKGAQIAIIKGADKMNPAASNALLKILEEPAPNHYIFLLTSQINKLLPTIISRAQVIRFKPLPRKYIMESLKENGVEKDISYVLSYITNDLEEAKEMIALGKAYNVLSVAKAVESAIAKGKDPFGYFYKSAKDLKAETDKRWHRIFLDILLLINKEIINYYNNKKLEYFTDIIELYNNEIKLDKVLHKIDVINKYQERLNYNINLNLFYASLMVEINK